jgi:2-polyprenyl-6-methoxyphenol hydroxylase-like FAD-dependent oxidoreductase
MSSGAGRAGARAFDGIVDTAVVGAGPVGCVTALAFARRGARVLLLEGHPGASGRLAGEWLHPAAVRVLDRLGLHDVATAAGHPRGRGFVVFPDDGTPPIVLPYAEGSVGLTCDHALLVSTLRQAAASHPHVELLEFAHVTRIDAGRVTFERPGRAGATTVVARHIVGADGRSSIVRRRVGGDPGRTFVSSTAGLRLDDVDLPFEGFGHLLLKGPGPAFIYRIAEGEVRACLDVPAGDDRHPDPAGYLWEAYRDAMPESLRPAFRRALGTRSIAWAGNQFRPRSCYGRDGLALVGDAVGHFHPLTAVGLTLGFLDAECLARSPSVDAYRRERSALSHVPELMATALYEVLAVPDRGARALRREMYMLLRGDRRERDRTMRLLAAEETELGGFGRPFLKVIAMASERVVRDVASRRQGRKSLPVLMFFVRRLAWLAINAVIGAIGPAPGPVWARCSALLGAVARRAAPTTARRAPRARPPEPRSLETDARPARAEGRALLDTRS